MRLIAAGAVAGVAFVFATTAFGIVGLAGLVVFVIVGSTLVLHLAGCTPADFR